MLRGIGYHLVHWSTGAWERMHLYPVLLAPRYFSTPARKGSIRKVLRFFYKHVHPDLTPHFNDTAKETNGVSLARLNAYIDVLEQSLTGENNTNVQQAPVVKQTLVFFKTYKTPLGKIIPTRLSPINVTLPTIRPTATLSEKEAIAVRLIRDLEISIESSSSQFLNKAKPPLIFSDMSFYREKMEELWRDMTRDAVKKSALYQADGAHLNRIVAMKRHFEIAKRKLYQRALQSRNRKRRKKRLEAVDAEAKRLVYEKFGEDPKEPAEDVKELHSKIKIIESGFHPDLVFVDPSLTEEQRKDGYNRICGLNLQIESDMWLLENVWKTMREIPPPVPIILGKEYDAISNKGFIRIPYQFNLWEFVDFLEEHLDDARNWRREVSLVTLHSTLQINHTFDNYA